LAETCLPRTSADWQSDPRPGAGCPARAFEWQLHHADLTVESVRWPVLAGHQPTVVTGSFLAAQSSRRQL